MQGILHWKKEIQILIVLAVFLLVFGGAYQNEKRHCQVWNSLEDTNVDEDFFAVSNPRVNYMVNPVGIDTNDIMFSWEPGVKQAAYEIVVRESDGMVSGQGTKVVWDSGIVRSSETICIPYKGEQLKDCSRYQFNIFVFGRDGNMYRSKTAFFETAFISQMPLEGAKFVTMAPEEKVYEDGQAVYYTSFAMQDKELKRATFYGSALGVYDAYLNGQRIGEDEFKPGWTDYNKTLLYNTYDITEYIKETNTIASMVGTGWWCGRNGFGTYGYNRPAFVAQIVLEYQDGSKQIVNTNEEWRYCKNTAVRFADYFNGETYDFSKITTAQISEGVLVSAADEKPVHISTDFKGEFKSFYGYGVKHVPEKDRIPSHAYIYKGVTEDDSDFGKVSIIRSFWDSEIKEAVPLVLKKGETLIVDLGQNMTGVPHVEYRAQKGTEIQIQFAEMLNDSGEQTRGNDGPEGSLYRANYRSATTLVSILSAGEEKENYHPTFFYTGFRYLSLTADKDIVLYDLKGLFIANSAPETGNIKIDDMSVDRLWRNVSWSQRNNFSLVATDCPQRDERIGWMGDLCSFAETSMYMQDLYGFYDKWIADVRDAQTEEGAYTDTVPSTITTGSGNAGWAEAGILVPLAVYKKYGDPDLLKDHYPSMQRYMEYLASISSYVPADKRMGPLTTYGDWLSTQLSDSNMLSALWYQADALAMEEIALLLGEKADAKRYRKLHGKINDYIMETYIYRMPWDRDGSVKDPMTIEYPLSQTEMLFLLSYSDLSEKQEQLIVANLHEDIWNYTYKVMTGFAGTPLLLPVLTEYGLEQEAYEMLLCDDNPSWMYSVEQGATTIWERYDSYTEESGFADASMNSFNHFNEGSVAQWMHESMLGIDVDVSEKYPVTICPVVPERKTSITRVSGYYNSVYGKITLEWEKGENDTLCVSLKIPENIKARVSLPIKGMENMVVSGGEYEWKGKYKLLE